MCEHGVKSGKAKVSQRKNTMPILSQAGKVFVSPEGAETTWVSTNDKPAHERPTLDRICRRVYPTTRRTTMPKGKAWTVEEYEWLQENYEKLGLKHCVLYLNRTATAILHTVNRMGLKRRGSGRAPRILIKDGYIWISTEGTQFALHRRLAEMYRGSLLKEGEVVHHEDGNRMNNAPENLTVTTIAEHNYKIHPKTRDSLGRFSQGDDIVRPSWKHEEVGDKELL